MKNRLVKLLSKFEIYTDPKYLCELEVYVREAEYKKPIATFCTRISEVYQEIITDSE